MKEGCWNSGILQDGTIELMGCQHALSFKRRMISSVIQTSAGLPLSPLREQGQLLFGFKGQGCLLLGQAATMQCLGGKAITQTLAGGGTATQNHVPEGLESREDGAKKDYS